MIRTAVSLGGDCDTLTCIASAIAEAFYGVPEELKRECRKKLPEDILKVLDRFDQMLVKNGPNAQALFFDGNNFSFLVENKKA